MLPPCGSILTIVGYTHWFFLFGHPKRKRKRCPLLPIAREARLKGAWVRAAHERFASAPLRIQERTDWPLPAANTLQWNCSQFLFLVAAFWQFVGGGVLDAPFWPRRGQCGGRRKSVKKNAALLHFLAFSLTDHLFGVPRGERLAAHNERRQFAAQTRSCGYSPRRGEHCSLPSFATLNCGPLLATPQPPKAGSAASQQRDFFRYLFWSQKR